MDEPQEALSKWPMQHMLRLVMVVFRQLLYDYAPVAVPDTSSVPPAAPFPSWLGVKAFVKVFDKESAFTKNP